MMNRLRFLFLVSLCLCLSQVEAQPARPATDVQAGEGVYAPAFMQDRSIVFYAIYTPANQIRAYALWNDGESVAKLHVEFVSGDPIDLVAQPGTRAGVNVASRGYTLTLDPTANALVDLNITQYQLLNDAPVKSTDRDRTFPIPTGSGSLP